VPGGEFTLRSRFLPRNDDCDEAFFLPPGTSDTPGLTWNATADDAPTCFDQDVTAPGVWFKVVGSGTTMTASTCGSADFDTKISVYCSGCGGMTCVGANDDYGGCGSRSSISWCSAPGFVYHILVHGYGSATGDFTLNVTSENEPCGMTRSCHPTNETCGGAIPAEHGTTVADNTGANTSGAVTACDPTNSDVWFSYTTECDGTLWIDTCQAELGSLENTVLSVYDGCDGLELDCNDDYVDEAIDCGLRSTVILQTQPHRDLLIRVADATSFVEQGTFPLRVTEVPAPVSLPGGTLPDGRVGERFGYQLPISGGCPIWFDGNTSLYSVLATGVPPGLELGMSGWLSGAPTVSGDYSIDVIVNDRDLGTPGARALFDVLVLPNNDNCEDATPISEGAIAFGNVGATTDGPGEPPAWAPSDVPNVRSDVWFRYTSSCEGVATASLCGGDPGYDTMIAVYDRARCPDSASAIACDDDTCDLQSAVSFAVEQGREYFLRVGGYGNAQGTGQLLVTCFNDCNDNGVSDLDDITAGTSQDCNGNGVPDSCSNDGFTCDDGNPCTTDSCENNQCVYGVTSCDDGIACTQDRCSTEAGCLHKPAACGDYDSDGSVTLGDFAS
jgi:hypothetical protein